MARRGWLVLLLCLGSSPELRASSEVEPRPGDISGAVVVEPGRRPLDAIEAELSGTQAEARDLERRLRILSSAHEQRQGFVRRRLRVLYKLSRGGFGRLLLGASTPLELYRVRDGARRVIERDLEELRALQQELGEVARERRELADCLARVDRLTQEAALARAQRSSGATREEAGLSRLRGELPRPVTPGLVTTPFGKEALERGLERFRHGVGLSAEAGAVVRAVASGQVRHSGELAGQGSGVIVEHEGGYLTLYGQLKDLMVVPGDRVAAGARLGRAAGEEIYFQLALGDLPLDPAPWLAAPVAEKPPPRKRR